MILKQALENGLLLKKIHRILRFNQSKWLEPYITFNNEKRKLAKNDFEKDFYKLLNNSMFGKSIENIRNRMKLELVNNERKLNRLISKPNFRNRIIYSKDLCAVELTKEVVLFNKPIYIGFTVLELSKFHMYNMHYKIMRSFYKPEDIQLLYMDTDSFFYQIYTNDVYKDFLAPEIKNYFDMSDFPVNHKCFSCVNKKRLGAFKDETCGICISEFVGLRSKLYAYKTVNDQFLQDVKKLNLKKAKGVTKPVVKNHITFNDYKNCLFNNVTLRKEMRLFRSKKHIMQTLTVNKIALNSDDDKRYICSDGIETKALGHYSIRNQKFKYINNKFMFM